MPLSCRRSAMSSKTKISATTPRKKSQRCSHREANDDRLLLIPMSEHPRKLHVPAHAVQRVLDLLKFRDRTFKLLLFLSALELFWHAFLPLLQAAFQFANNLGGFCNQTLGAFKVGCAAESALHKLYGLEL